MIAIHLARLNRWGGQTLYPFLLSIYRRYDHNELDAEGIARILQLLESFLVRRFLARVPTNQLNRLFIRLAQQLPPDLDPVAGTHSALSKSRLRWPTDVDLRAALTHFPFYTEGRYEQRRLIIETLEANYQHKEAVDLTSLTIEHIMPQTLSPEWRMALGDTAEEVHGRLTHVLGNLTLTGYNPELSNSPFEQKRQLLAQSNLEMNKEIAAEVEWTATQIEERGKQLAERVVNIWPGPTNVFAPTVPSAGDVGGQTAPPARNWDKESIFVALASYGSDSGLQATQRLYDFAESRGAKFYYNSGPWPAVTAQVQYGNKWVSAFGIYPYAEGRSSIAINFQYLADHIPAQTLAQLAQRLRTIPGVAARYVGLEEAQFRKRPSLSIEEILAQPGAVEIVETALDELMQAGSQA